MTTKGFIVYPEGDFDNCAVIIDAEDAETAAAIAFERVDFKNNRLLLVVPFEDIRTFERQVNIVEVFQ